MKKYKLQRKEGTNESRMDRWKEQKKEGRKLVLLY